MLSYLMTCNLGIVYQVQAESKQRETREIILYYAMQLRGKIPDAYLTQFGIHLLVGTRPPLVRMAPLEAKTRRNSRLGPRDDGR